MSDRKSLTLQESRQNDTTNAYFVHVDSNGQFVLTDYLVGAFSMETFGFEDVEWNLVVVAPNKDALFAKLLETARMEGKEFPIEGDSDDRLLAIMGVLYCGDDKAYTHFKEWLDAAAFPYSIHYWPGDRVSKPDLKPGDPVLLRTEKCTYRGTLVSNEGAFWLVELDQESNDRMEKVSGKTSQQLKLPPRHRYAGWSRLSLASSN